MRGSILVCNGANISCAKGDTRRVLRSVTAYCKENPNEDFVPVAVTDRDTIHWWECVGSKARIKKSEKVTPVASLLTSGSAWNDLFTKRGMTD